MTDFSDALAAALGLILGLDRSLTEIVALSLRVSLGAVAIAAQRAGVDAMRPGVTAEVKVLRDGKEQTIEVKLGEMPGVEQQASLDEPTEEEGSILEDFGLTVAPAEEGEGVVVTDVQANSDAADLVAHVTTRNRADGAVCH